MKRSDYVALGAVGVLTAGFLIAENSGPSGGADTEPTESALIYASVEECIKAEVLDRASCEREFGAAKTQHVSVAPKFSKQAECEAHYGAGKCQSSPWSGAEVFVPIFAGVMIANYLSGNRQAQPLMPAINGRALPCPPGMTPAQMPGCIPPRQPQQQQSSSSSSASSFSRGSSSSGSSWRWFSTGNGDTVSSDSSDRGRSTVTRSSTERPSARSSFGVPSARASFSSSSSISRGGFGSSGRGFSSSS